MTTRIKLVRIARCCDCPMYGRCEFHTGAGEPIPERCPLPDERPPIGTNFSEQYDKI